MKELPIKVGVITDQTGPLSFMGIANANVAKMVIDDINANGGLLTRWWFLPLPQQRAEQVGPPRLVVDVADQRVLDRDPAAGGGRRSAGRRRAPRRPSSGVLTGTSVSRSSSSGRVQRDRERDRSPRRPAGRSPARGRPWRRCTERWEMPSPSGAGAVIRRTAAEHPLVVGQRLAHAHEHDVGEPAGAAASAPSRAAAAAGAPGRRSPRWTGCVQPALAGRAERAGHPAAGLAGHAERDPVRVAHQHATRRSVPSCARHSVLRVVPSSQASCRTGVSSGGSSARRAGPAAAAGRSVIAAEVGGEPAEVVAGELVGPERGLAELGDGGAALRGRRGRRGGGAGARAWARRTRGEGRSWHLRCPSQCALPRG